MRIIVYKGFDKKFYETLTVKPLVNNSLEEKLKPEFLSKQNYDSTVVGAVFSSDQDSEAYITYEEFIAAYSTLITPLFSSHVIDIVSNNIYPELYPAPNIITEESFNDYQKIKESEKTVFSTNPALDLLCKYYSDICKINGKYYVSYHNNEIKNGHFSRRDYYSSDLSVPESNQESEFDYIFDISDSAERYIECLDEIKNHNFSNIAYRNTENTEIAKAAEQSLKAFCLNNEIRLTKIRCDSNSSVRTRDELVDITRTMIESTGNTFNGFKTFKVYRNPRISNETEPISQGEVMEYIAREAENAALGLAYRDIFFTAPTGAGKSITFQVPARYIADKYGKLVIVIEPLKGLMKDQVDNLKKTYGNKVDFINSDVATPADRDRIIEGIKNGKINILYVSPETLISRTIESLIGDREIGLVIIDEAHIVTAWGMGFRPDYWYLGAYIDRLRNERNGRGIRDTSKKTDRFPIFACTATAVNGGWDDTVSETFISLTMNDPIVILGYARRDDDIRFDIRTHLEKMTKNVYRENKADELQKRLTEWHNKNEKTIVYSPYRAIANSMKNAENEFCNFDKLNNCTGIYTGGGDDPNQKNEDMDKFKSGEIKTMYATKAFGMGVDIKDVNNVYHYAPTGSLADYVQEIGRVARKEGMVGLAVTDYYLHDMEYINALYGMSQINKTHIMQCLRIIYDTYKQKGGKQRFVVAPSMFDSVFRTTKKNNDDKGEAEAKLKIALLMIEKDLRNTYRIPVFVSRPGTVFTNSYVQVAGPRVKDVLNSRYGRFFKQKTSYEDGLNKYYIYEVHLSEIWEKCGYDHMSFPEFKYHYFNKNADGEKVMPEIIDYFRPQALLSLEAKDGQICELYDKAKRHIDNIMAQLASFSGQYFTIDEFSKKLASSTNGIKYNKYQAESIANSFFSVVDPTESCAISRIDHNSSIINYRISNGNLRNLAEATLDKSLLIKNMFKTNGNKLERYIPLDSREDSNALKLLSLFDIASYTVEGGNEPQISIWLNSPDKIRQIVTGRIQYNNKYVKKAFEKHVRSVRILKYFFEELKTDKARWDFIERYFLGEDVLGDIKPADQPPMEPLNRYVVPGSGLDIKNIYHSWNDFIKAESSNNTENAEKYLYAYRQLEKANIRMPDVASAIIRKGSNEIEPLFIFKDENVLILSEYTKKNAWDLCRDMGWKAFGIDDLEDDVEKLREALNG